MTAAASLLAVLLMAGTAHGDTLFGVYAGAGVWQQEYSGEVASLGEAIDVEDDLAMEDQGNNVIYVAVEHGVPVLPNVRVNYADITTSGSNDITRELTFRGQVYSASENVRSELNLTQVEAVAYYEVLDNVVSLDLGLAARMVDGDVEVVSDSGTGRAEFEGVLPLLYARARADLPLTGLWVGAEAMGVSYDGHSMTDFNAQVGWESPMGLGAELGWRALNLELDSFEDIDNAELDVSGPYAAVNFHF